MSIQPNDEVILLQHDMMTLTRMWHELNTWKWPTEFSDPEPVSAPRFEGKPDRRWDIMCWIVEAIVLRVIIREGNRDMSEEEFNNFWRGCYEGHKPSYDRYMHWMREKVLSRAVKDGE